MPAGAPAAEALVPGPRGAARGPRLRGPACSSPAVDARSPGGAGRRGHRLAAGGDIPYACFLACAAVAAAPALVGGWRLGGVEVCAEQVARTSTRSVPARRAGARRGGRRRPRRAVGHARAPGPRGRRGSLPPRAGRSTQAPCSSSPATGRRGSRASAAPTASSRAATGARPSRSGPAARRRSTPPCRAGDLPVRRYLDDVVAHEARSPASRAQQAPAPRAQAPATSGVPVPGAKAGSSTSMSNPQVGRPRGSDALADPAPVLLRRPPSAARGRGRFPKAPRARLVEVGRRVQRAAHARQQRAVRVRPHSSSSARRNGVPWRFLAVAPVPGVGVGVEQDDADRACWVVVSD